MRAPWRETSGEKLSEHGRNGEISSLQSSSRAGISVGRKQRSFKPSENNLAAAVSSAAMPLHLLPFTHWKVKLSNNGGMKKASIRALTNADVSAKAFCLRRREACSVMLSPRGGGGVASHSWRRRAWLPSCKVSAAREFIHVLSLVTIVGGAEKCARNAASTNHVHRWEIWCSLPVVMAWRISVVAKPVCSQVTGFSPSWHFCT